MEKEPLLKFKELRDKPGDYSPFFCPNGLNPDYLNEFQGIDSITRTKKNRGQRFIDMLETKLKENHKKCLIRTYEERCSQQTINPQIQLLVQQLNKYAHIVNCAYLLYSYQRINPQRFMNIINHVTEKAQRLVRENRY